MKLPDPTPLNQCDLDVISARVVPLLNAANTSLSSRVVDIPGGSVPGISVPEKPSSRDSRDSRE